MPSMPQTNGADSVSLGQPSFLHDLRAFLKEWIRLNWMDVLLMLTIGALSMCVRADMTTFTSWVYPC